MSERPRLLLLPNPVIMYPVAVAVRDHVERLVLATSQGRAERGLPPDPIVGSRLPDRVVETPVVPASSRSQLASETTRRWAASIERICREEGLDAVMSGSDDEIAALVEHRELLESSGVRVLHPAEEAARGLGDTLDLYALAVRAGIPMPLTRGMAEVRRDGWDGSFPVVVKRRLSQGAAGVRQVDRAADLAEMAEHLADSAEEWLVQEYVPGRFEPSVTCWSGESPAAGTLLQHFKHRYVSSGGSTAVEIVDGVCEPARVWRLLDSVGARGHFGLQFKLDERDGVPRLIEVNPRLGQNTRLLLPMLADPGRRLLAPFGLAEVSEAATVPVGTIGLSPLDDLLATRVWWAARSAPSARADNPPPSPRGYLGGVLATYRRDRIVLDVLSRRLAREPRVVLGMYGRLLGAVADGRAASFVPWSTVSGRAPIGSIETLLDRVRGKADER